MPRTDLPRVLAVTSIRDRDTASEQQVAFLARQSLRPVAWVLVAREPTIALQRHCLEHAWLHPHILEEGQSYESAAVRVASHRSEEWDYLCCIDGEPDAGPDFLESLVDDFRKDDCLGVVSAEVPGPLGQHGEALAGEVRLYSRSFFQELHPSAGVGSPWSARQDAAGAPRVRYFGWLPARVDERRGSAAERAR